MIRWCFAIRCLAPLGLLLAIGCSSNDGVDGNNSPAGVAGGAGTPIASGGMIPGNGGALLGNGGAANGGAAPSGGAPGVGGSFPSAGGMIAAGGTTPVFTGGAAETVGG